MPAPQNGPGTQLYQQLRTATLDPQRVYHIREASLDREDIHISLDDGTIAFTEDVFGRPTAAFFVGEGEILLVPQDRAERLSMGLFTGSAILEEKFSSAYLRFNDDTFRELQPALRPPTDAQDFVTKWGPAARTLAEADALRLLTTFSRYLPSSGKASSSEKFPFEDRMLHARIQGERLGTFDVFFDTTASEQISVGQLNFKDGVSYYDTWASFPMRSARDPKIAARLKTLQAEATISDYRIRARVTPPRELAADTVLTLQTTVPGERTLLFELSRFLEVHSVQIDGQPLEFIHNPALEGTQLARRGNDMVAVVFPRPLSSGEKLTLRFAYSGSVLSEAGGGLLYVGARGTWYPNRGVQMANFDLQFAYPPQWTLLATGHRTTPETSGALATGEQVERWNSERPIPIAGFNLGRYERASAHSGNIEVDTYAASSMERAFPRPRPVPEPPGSKPPGNVALPPLVTTPNPALTAQAVANRSAHAIDFMSRMFGPFPYSSLALTQMPGFESQGWPGLIFLSSLAFLTPEERTRLHMGPYNSILSDELMVDHETAHQWWGDLVMFRTYRDQWVVEALANYSALMLIEQERPADFATVLDEYRHMLLKPNKDGEPNLEAGAVTLGQRLNCSKFPDGYDIVSYGRGTWLFHMLRHMLIDATRPSGTRVAAGENSTQAGDVLFRKILRDLLQRSAGQTVSTTDVQKAFEAELPRPLWYEGKKSLDWFFEDWVNGTAIPKLELSNVKFSHRNGSAYATGSVRQEDAPEDLTTSVPIYAVAGAGPPVLLGRIFAEGRETQFRLPAPAGARRLLVDPYRTVLSQVH
ncbi:MAG TPA: M1 family aminopeptidase [Terriglobales bacterium]|nr:M1 family aminopeptidase [Terriglobales bacterium]